MDKKEYYKQWRSKNKEKLREVSRKWRLNNLDKAKAWLAKWKKENRAKVVLLQKKYAKRHPEKRVALVRRYRQKPENKIKERARELLRYAVKTGKIEKEGCQECGELKVEAHHEDYNKPFDVKWLCPKHHKQEHRLEVNNC